MNWFNNLSIKYKIGAIALIGIVGLVSTFLVSYRLIESVKFQLNHTIDTQLPTMQFINDLQVGFAEVQDLYQSASMTSDSSILKQADDSARLLEDQFYDVKSDNVTEQAQLHRLQNALKSYVDAVSSTTSLVIATGNINNEQVIKGFTEADALRETYEDMQKKFANDWHEGFKNDLTRIQEREDQIIGGSTVIGLLAAILLVVFSALIIRIITRVLGNAVSVADKIASGNLNQEIEVLANDESGRLMNSLRVMRDAL
ncbi:MAG: HAMP domain-containing protein, partial [Pseudomonadota bacterium]